tara:strand:+ start:2882 stop:3085 length:204 start_codon:yes stop_codon:yes gene_type:complete
MGCGCKKNKSKMTETKRTVSSKNSPQFGVAKKDLDMLEEKIPGLAVVKLTETDLKKLINKVLDKTND